ncbi:MAG: hypothetical protein AAF591_08360 [Verrucomicrobiota bacterium]
MKEQSHNIEKSFCALVEKAKTTPLSRPEQTFVDVYHALGFIQCEGLHGFFGLIDDDFTRIGNSFKAAALLDCSRIVAQAHDLWKTHCGESHSQEIDAFRTTYDIELTQIEEQFYDQESNIMTSLENFIKIHSLNDPD